MSKLGFVLGLLLLDWRFVVADDLSQQLDWDGCLSATDGGEEKG